MTRYVPDAAALMRALVFLILLLIIWILTAPVAAAAEEKTRAETEAALRELDVTLKDLGQETYYLYCAACHGLEARGHGIAANALDPRPADLTQIAKRRGGKIDRKELVEIIDGRKALVAHGSRSMPVWGIRFGSDVPDASRREDVAMGKIRVIVHYLLSIQEKVEPPKTPSSP